MADLGFIGDLWFDRRGELDERMRLADLIKASFGGDRSAAGRYAAEQRWKNHKKKEEDAKGRQAGDESLDDEISRVVGLMSALRELPYSASKFGDDIIEVEEWENYSGSLFVGVVIRGKRFRVATKQVIEAEQAVNALGKRVLAHITEKLIAEGKLTQQQVDDAKKFQSAQEVVDSAEKSLIDKAMRGDDDVPDEVREAAIKVSEAKEKASEARKALVKATKAYNQQREIGGFSDEKSRQLYWARMEAKNNSSVARSALKQAEYELERVVGFVVAGEREMAGETQKSKEAQKANSVLVQQIIGAEFQAFLSSRREMGEVYPSRNTTVPQRVFDKSGKLVDGNALAADIMGVAARRFPQALLSKTETPLGKKVEIVFGGRGGSYNESNNRIRSDLDDSDTLTHETVHNISYYSRETRAIEQAGLQRRIFGKVDEGDASFAEKLKIGLQKTVGATKALGYRFEGSYVEDKFVNGYQGRLDYNYGSRKEGYNLTRATEILTVSTENAFGGNYKFKQTGKLDDDLLATAIGWLLTAEGGQ
jgi:hypothetical protein